LAPQGQSTPTSATTGGQPGPRENWASAPYPPVVSDTAMADLVHRAAAATVGEEYVDIAVPITVGDDVACFLQRAPGCYFLVGAGHPELGPVPPHHSADFDIDEAALPVGVETLVRASLDVLG
jgi:metal-dependent amidase/aminoacylase/carboxypeptidase family protein